MSTAINQGVFSSNKQDWATPQSFVDLVSAHFRIPFDIDVCAEALTTKCPIYFDKTQNALSLPWNGNCWMNPPYGSELPTWLEYAYEQSQTTGATVVCLVPARTDTRWFHEYACKGSIVFLEGRIPFEQQGKIQGSPAFPSMLVFYNYTPTLPPFSTWKWK